MTNTLFTALRTAVYAAAFIALWIWVALGIGGLDEYIRIPLPDWSAVPGTILLVTGGIIAAACLSMFVVRGSGTGAPFDPPREFVPTGPYRFVRNPMYIGGWCMLAGLGLFRHSISMFLFSLAWLLLIHVYVVFFEEKGLERRFGPRYIEYKSAVNRWLPRMR